MGRIPTKLNDRMNEDPFYQTCCLRPIMPGHTCGGKLTREHAIIYAHKQLQKYWAIIPVCERGHSLGAFWNAHTMNKELNVWVALNRATDEELRAVSKVIDYIRERDRLNEKYGHYRIPPVSMYTSAINYGI